MLRALFLFRLFFFFFFFFFYDVCFAGWGKYSQRGEIIVTRRADTCLLTEESSFIKYSQRVQKGYLTGQRGQYSEYEWAWERKTAAFHQFHPFYAEGGLKKCLGTYLLSLLNLTTNRCSFTWSGHVLPLLPVCYVLCLASQLLLSTSLAVTPIRACSNWGCQTVTDVV